MTPEIEPSGQAAGASAARLLFELRAVLGRRMPEPAACALVQRIQRAISEQGSVSAQELQREFEQLEDALEFVLFSPEAPPA